MQQYPKLKSLEWPVDLSDSDTGYGAHIPSFSASLSHGERQWGADLTADTLWHQFPHSGDVYGVPCAGSR